MSTEKNKEDPFNDAAHALLSLSTDAAPNSESKMKGIEISKGTMLHGVRTASNLTNQSKISAQYNERQVTRKMNALLKAFAGPKKSSTPVVGDIPDLKLPLLNQNAVPSSKEASPSPQVTTAESSTVSDGGNNEIPSPPVPKAASHSPIAAFLGAPAFPHAALSQPVVPLPQHVSLSSASSSSSEAVENSPDIDMTEMSDKMALPNDHIMRKREKNRLAARRSRARKSQLFSTAHNEIERLNQLVAYLQGERIYLLRRISELEEQVFAQKNQPNAISPQLSKSPSKSFADSKVEVAPPPLPAETLQDTENKPNESSASLESDSPLIAKANVSQPINA